MMSMFRRARGRLSSRPWNIWWNFIWCLNNGMVYLGRDQTPRNPRWTGPCFSSRRGRRGACQSDRVCSVCRFFWTWSPCCRDSGCADPSWGQRKRSSWWRCQCVLASPWRWATTSCRGPWSDWTEVEDRCYRNPHLTRDKGGDGWAT